VVLVKNVDPRDGLVNGARGVVTRLTRDTKRPVVRFTDGVERTVMNEVSAPPLPLTQNHGDRDVCTPLSDAVLTARAVRQVFSVSVAGRVVAQRTQLPLDLAWGLSVRLNRLPPLFPFRHGMTLCRSCRRCISRKGWAWTVPCCT